VTGFVVLGLAVFVFHGASQAHSKLATDTLHANLTQACVLALPANPDTGRDPALVRLCFTQYDLQPPQLQNP
jgi:hypothetical protein